MKISKITNNSELPAKSTERQFLKNQESKKSENLHNPFNAMNYDIATVNYSTHFIFTKKLPS